MLQGRQGLQAAGLQAAVGLLHLGRTGQETNTFEKESSVGIGIGFEDENQMRVQIKDERRQDSTHNERLPTLTIM